MTEPARTLLKQAAFATEQGWHKSTVTRLKQAGRLVMVGGRLYDGNTLDEVWPRQRALPTQPWAYVVPTAGAGLPSAAPRTPR